MNSVARLMLAGVSTLALTVPSVAQEIVQADSQWYTDGQALVEKMIALQPNTSRAKNVILFVGDGMGVGTNYAIRLYAGQQQGELGEEHVLPQEAFPYTALVKTYNINAQTPDSAPTAGAMNSGVKQIYNTINLNENAVFDDCSTESGNQLTLFSELVSGADKSVGVVTTTRLTHATPAAVYAKTANRNWEGVAPEGCTDIGSQLLSQMEAGVIDVAFGGGSGMMVPTGTQTAQDGEGTREDGRNILEEAAAAGIQVANDTAGFEALTLDGSAPALGVFTTSDMTYEAERVAEREPSLAEMTEGAIKALSTNEGGFYLMVEGGRIDHANHGGNASRMMQDGVAFAEAIAKADELTDDADTLIIVTADHEHGIAFNGYCGRGTPIDGLCMGIASGQIEHTGVPELAADGKPYPVIAYANGAGSVLVEQEDGTYSGSRPDLTQEDAQDIDYLQQALVPMSSETHAGVDVAAWAKGPWAHLLTGTVEQNYIFHVMNQAVSAE